MYPGIPWIPQEEKIQVKAADMLMDKLSNIWLIDSCAGESVLLCNHYASLFNGRFV